MEHVYGWIKQQPDSRDLNYPKYARPLTGLPQKIDLRPNMPPIYDQGRLGSCTANGIARCYQYAEIRAKFPSIMPSRLFLYYNERLQEGTVDIDNGAVIRDGIKACNIYGVVDEQLWPYKTNRFADKPDQEVYDVAKTSRIKFYASLQNQDLDHCKLCMVHGWPIVFGFDVHTNFENYTSGILNLPTEEESYLGGHCVTTAGYDNEKQAVLCANSYGQNWGENGYFWMSYNYFMSPKVSDCWMMRLV